MKVAWTQRAKIALVEIADYIAADDRDAALRLVRRIRDRVRKAARMPGSGRAVPELAHADLREVLVGNYRIIYRVDRQLIVILVIEGHMLLPPDIS